MISLVCIYPLRMVKSERSGIFNTGAGYAAFMFHYWNAQLLFKGSAAHQQLELTG